MRWTTPHPIRHGVSRALTVLFALFAVTAGVASLTLPDIPFLGRLLSVAIAGGIGWILINGLVATRFQTPHVHTTRARFTAVSGSGRWSCRQVDLTRLYVRSVRRSGQQDVRVGRRAALIADTRTETGIVVFAFRGPPRVEAESLITMLEQARRTGHLPGVQVEPLPK